MALLTVTSRQVSHSPQRNSIHQRSSSTGSQSTGFTKSRPQARQVSSESGEGRRAKSERVSAERGCRCNLVCIPVIGGVCRTCGRDPAVPFHSPPTGPPSTRVEFPVVGVWSGPRGAEHVRSRKGQTRREAGTQSQGSPLGRWPSRRSKDILARDME